MGAIRRLRRREAYTRNYDARWLSTTVKMFSNIDLHLTAVGNAVGYAVEAL